MDYEKKYKNALAWAKAVYNGETGFVRNEVEEVFPELKESKDERIRKDIISYLALYKDAIGEEYESWIAWLEKQCEQKPEWTPMDEQRVENLLAIIEGHGYPGEVAWLNSLKDRVLSQPKQEWSEEDKEVINLLLELVYEQDKMSPQIPSNEKRKRMLSWLKSLRPQDWTKEDKERYISCLQRLSTGNPEQPETINSKWFKEHVYPQPTWKPSDAQIKALESTTEYCVYSGYQDCLRELIEQLKKLKL